MQPAKNFFTQFQEQKPESKGIFARIPAELYKEITAICDAEGQSYYAIVTIALTLLVKQYHSHSHELPKPKKEIK